MNFQQEPNLTTILQAENLTVIDVNGKTLTCSDQTGNKYFLKECNDTEEKIYTQVFPAIEQQNLQFEILQLPKHNRIFTKLIDGANRKLILINLYEGTSFNDKWNEGSPDGYGGRAIESGFSDKVIKLLSDFAKIDITQLESFNLSAFEFDTWKSQNMLFEAQTMIQRGVLTDHQVQKAASIIGNATAFQNSQRILTNGDFYPRNFIELPTGKIVVIDWEGAEDYHQPVSINGVTNTIHGQRRSLINFIENHLAFFFVHMWGNYPIQRSILKTAMQKFSLNKNDLQIAMLIKSFEQAFAFGRSCPAVRLAETFNNALDMNYIDDLLR